MFVYDGVSPHLPPAIFFFPQKLKNTSNYVHKEKG
jgi:hypothetical protein